MPTETIIVLGGVIAMFAVFTIVVTYSDMTWSKPQRRRVSGSAKGSGDKALEGRERA